MSVRGERLSEVSSQWRQGRGVFGDGRRSWRDALAAEKGACHSCFGDSKVCVVTPEGKGVQVGCWRLPWDGARQHQVCRAAGEQREN